MMNKYVDILLLLWCNFFMFCSRFRCFWLGSIWLLDEWFGFFFRCCSFLSFGLSFFLSGIFFALLAAAFFEDFFLTALLLAARLSFFAATVLFLPHSSLSASLNEGVLLFQWHYMSLFSSFSLKQKATDHNRFQILMYLLRWHFFVCLWMTLFQHRLCI